MESITSKKQKRLYTSHYISHKPWTRISDGLVTAKSVIFCHPDTVHFCLVGVQPLPKKQAEFLN